MKSMCGEEGQTNQMSVRSKCILAFEGVREGGKRAARTWITHNGGAKGVAGVALDGHP